MQFIQNNQHVQISLLLFVNFCHVLTTIDHILPCTRYT